MLKKRETVYNPPFQAHGEAHMRWIENTHKAGLRFVAFADEILSLNYTGWFTSEFQDETLRGVVYQLPSRQGCEQYVYGYNDPCIDGSALLSFDVSEDKENAARWADNIAERAAEEERDYQEAWQAGSRHYDIGHEMATIRQTCLALIREAKANCLDIRKAPAILEQLRRDVMRYADDLEQMRNERTELRERFSDRRGFSDV